MRAWLDTAGACGACRTVPGMLSPIPGSSSSLLLPGGSVPSTRGCAGATRGLAPLFPLVSEALERAVEAEDSDTACQCFSWPRQQHEAPAFISTSGFVNKVEGKSRKAAVSKVHTLGDGAAAGGFGADGTETRSNQTFPQLPPAVFLFLLEN